MLPLTSQLFRSARVAGLSRIVAALALAALAGACKDSTAPPTPASVAPDATTIADGTAGIILAPAPGFTVKDGDGNVLGGVSITVAVTAGGGTLTDPPSKTQSGGATPVGQWKLGDVAGVNSITVTVPGLSPLVISVNGKAGPPASLTFVSGANQSAFAGTIVGTQPVAQVRDQFSNGVSGVPVTFSISDGDGSVSATPVTTDASGNAESPQWQLGKSAVPQALRASAGGFSAFVDAFVNSDYSVDLSFFGPAMPPAASAAFIAAAARISGSVIGDVSDIAAPDAGIDLSDCGVTGVTLTGVVDDVAIYAAVAPIDGSGRVLARAGPCFIRSLGRQTIVGVMIFDSDDIQPLIDNGRLRDVIQHEMLHVVGIGTLWNAFGVIAGAGTPETRFTGTLGVSACIAIGGAAVCPGSVPVENTGGAGTADGHWRESVFATELMTGFVGQTNPLSAMSIQSLGDLGYVVNENAADTYTVPGQSAARLLSPLSDPPAAWEHLVKPKFEMTRTGQISPVERQ